MSYATYTTDALVCGAFDRNTADRTYLLYTREAGMLYAEAKSVREERSKQRYALQEFTHIRVSLVKGKRSWKIGSVLVVHNDYARASSREARGSVIRIYRTLHRFIQGEDASPTLFDFCTRALEAAAGSVVARDFFEAYVLVLIMHELGYVALTSIPESLRAMTIEEAAGHSHAALTAELTTLYTHASEQSQL